MSNDRPHRIYMQFFLRNGWNVSFLEADAKTPLPRSFTFSDPDKIRELALRGGALGTSEEKQLFEYAIEQGRGGMWLNLTPEQWSVAPLTGDTHRSRVSLRGGQRGKPGCNDR
jgi:hypothetical protein